VILRGPVHDLEVELLLSIVLAVDTSQMYL
jgi:hypothetical protein